MIIRRIFPAKDIVEIHEELRRIYGNNFVVIEINRVKEKSLPFLPFLAKEYTEVIIEIPDEEPIQKQRKPIKESSQKATPLGEGSFKEALEKELLLKSLEELKKELATLKEALSKQKVKKINLTWDKGKPKLDKEDEKFLNQLGDEALNLFDLLLEKGVDEKLIVEILKHATGFDIENKIFDLKDQPLNALATAFEELFTFGRLENSEEQTIVSLIGPTGVGKTTTIAKIVSNLVLNHNKKVGVISLDTFRVGGTQRLENYLKVLEIPFRKADTKKAFDVALEDFSDKDFIFVDIAGRSIYDELSWKEVFNIFSSLEEEKLKILLTVSFTMSEDTILEIFNHLKRYKLDGWVFTKADETRKRGVVLNVLAKTQMPLFYITNGQKVPHNLLVGSPINLAKVILE
jgi:flagellar biosynthesis protein FlhF